MMRMHAHVRACGAHTGVRHPLLAGGERRAHGCLKRSRRPSRKPGATRFAAAPCVVLRQHRHARKIEGKRLFRAEMCAAAACRAKQTQ
eukprot:6204679-Pleurochrysis_carterae.AAC.1